jgi:hypothetical protein
MKARHVEIGNFRPGKRLREAQRIDRRLPMTRYRCCLYPLGKDAEQIFLFIKRLYGRDPSWWRMLPVSKVFIDVRAIVVLE